MTRDVMRVLVVGLASVLWLAGPLKAIEVSAEDDPEYQALLDAARVIEFTPMEDGFSAENSSELGNGIVVDRKNFPTLLGQVGIDGAKFQQPNCTAAIVGPTSVLTAAHCFGDEPRSEPIEVFFSLPNGKTEAFCERSDGYLEGRDAEDWALCRTKKRISGTLFETISSASPPNPGKELVLTGFGCVLWGHPKDGKLRFGVAKVIDRPPGAQVLAHTVYVRGESEKGGSQLCSGDSGGPAFSLLGNKVNGPRKIIAINARSNFDEELGYLALVSSPPAQAWMKAWAKDRKSEICGINLDDETCR